MIRVDLAEAKHRLDELVDDVSKGKIVEIMDDGRPVARLTPPAAPRKPVDLAALQALTETMPHQGQTAGDFLRALRDSERY